MNADIERPTGGVGAKQRATRVGERLERTPFAVVLAGAVLYFGVAAGLASIGGWGGLALVLCLAAAVVAAIVEASG